ncbi:hypothetical protein B7P43_G02737 [Cryptotermes secundus]|uniref:Tc1-like transposase DDE domain-containing protein n=1 Tax=Cryptotermes secundus TaxID=105785 RepID=A0A2J7Q3M3_9NEOP|nr:hypothetical protein B7P43_G02737 [Cryptotermes secundus]
MAALLSVCTKEEQRSVIRFLWSEGLSGAAIHQRLSGQYGKSVLLQRSVYEWIEKLKNCCTSVMHEEGARQPSTATNEDNIEHARDMVLLDRRVTIDEVANHLQISHGSAYEIIHNRLGFHKVCARWVPKELTVLHKQIKRRGLLSKGVVLLHDNARPHTAAHTAETLQKLKFDVMAHPPYSPDLAPSDYHLFGPLKEALRGRRFTSDQEVKEAVHVWLATQPKTFFSEGIRKLVQRWTKCVEKQGDCIKKLILMYVFYLYRNKIYSYTVDNY